MPIALILLLSLTSCQFLMSPAGIAIEEEVVKDIVEIVEEEFEEPKKD